jgi:hypothetical protein
VAIIFYFDKINSTPQFYAHSVCDKTTRRAKFYYLLLLQLGHGFCLVKNIFAFLSVFNWVHEYYANNVQDTKDYAIFVELVLYMRYWYCGNPLHSSFLHQFQVKAREITEYLQAEVRWTTFQPFSVLMFPLDWKRKSTLETRVLWRIYDRIILISNFHRHINN